MCVKGTSVPFSEKNVQNDEKPCCVLCGRVFIFPECKKKMFKKGEYKMFRAVLTTTILPLDGTYRVTTLPQGEIPNIQGVPHYVGHPDTKAIVEELGAVPAPSKLFEGLQPGESAVCFPIAQGKSTRAVDGFTTPHQSVTLNDLTVRVITRLE